MKDLTVTVWNEYYHERHRPDIAAIYPQGIHGTIGAHLQLQGMTVRTAALDDAEHGMTHEVLDSTDVLIWWGHVQHAAVSDEIVERIYQRVMDGMGLIVLHSAHHSKIFRKLMGTTGNLKWREAGEKERIWVVMPSHPIAAGLGDHFEIPAEEMYGEYFDIPTPDELVLVSWFKGGEVFRSGCCWNRGLGKVFYFRPGHETHPTYHQTEVLRVIANAVRWAAPTAEPDSRFGHAHRPEPLEQP